VSATAAPEASVSGWNGCGVTVADVAERLAEQRRPAGGGPPFTLSGVLNLIAHCPAGDLDAMREVVEHLSDHQPSRAVLVTQSEDGEGIDAAVSTSCRLAGGRASVVERVELTLRGEARAGAASAIGPLLRSELPTVLWWPGAPDPSPDGPLARLAELCDRVVTEVERDGDAAAALANLAGWASDDGPPVTDMAWAAITSWRRLITQVVDEGALARLRAAPASAVVAHPGARPNAKALLMAGWLRNVAGETLAVTLESRPGDGDDLVAVEVAGSRSGRSVVIERLPGRGAAAVCVTEADGTDRRRVLPLPSPDRARLLAGELELQRRDRAFERALRAAA
jgi:glucose-6-phosphate dehydrogenase assembly protein OpcA